MNINGRRSCLDPCQVMSCPEGERCELHSGGLPVCACRAGQVKNKLTGRCEAKSGCASDADCHSTQACRADQGYGAFRTCVDVCAAVSCAQGADCVAKDHRGYCKCQDGFTGEDYCCLFTFMSCLFTF